MGGLNKRSRRQGPESFRAMRHGKCSNYGSIGNVESVTYRRHYPGDGTNPALCGGPFRYLRRTRKPRPNPNQTNECNRRSSWSEARCRKHAKRQASRMTNKNNLSKRSISYMVFCSSCSSFLAVRAGYFFGIWKIVTACLPRACTMPFYPFCLDWPIMFCVSCGRDDTLKRTNPSSSVASYYKYCV